MNHNINTTDESIDIMRYPLALDIMESLETTLLPIESLLSKNSNSFSNNKKKSLLLTSKHISPITTRRWKEVLSWATFHPDEVSNLRDIHNQTVLHHACLFKAPSDIIEAFLFADSSGLLASVANDEGEFPIHWAVRVSASVHILKILVNANPKSGFIADVHGVTAFSLIWDRNEKALNEFVFDGLFETCSYSSQLLAKDTFLIRGRFEESWSKNQFSIGTMMMLLHSYYCGSLGEDENKSEFLPLHAVAGNPHVPFSFFTFIAKVFHDKIRRRDYRGRHPLAVACSSIEMNIDIINFLLLLDPDSPTISDYQGRYPLSLAVEVGLPCDMCANIFNAAPPILSIRDVRTGLYPFMLASVGTSCDLNYDATSSQNELNRLNNAFFLLLKDPECVRPIRYK